MTIFIEGLPFGYELQRVAQLFFFGGRVTVEEAARPSDFSEDYAALEVRETQITAEARIEGRVASRVGECVSQQSALEHALGVLLYGVLSELTGLSPEWGVLTGIRPVKLFISRLNAGEDEAQLHGHFVGECLLSEARFRLGLQTAVVEQPLLRRSTADSFSLYISIPFCPSRCAYCSFVSHSVEQAGKLIPVYVDKLCEELRHTAAFARQKKLRLRTVYFGGGTPTTLSAEQLERIMGVISDSFDLEGLWEYTVEAGRPDTITEEKLRVIRQGGAGRISINPQTLSDDVLRAIGRRHTAARVMECFKLAKEAGFPSINMDLIAGLPTDTPEGFRASMDGVLEAEPENVTVHTLTVKRAARLTTQEAAGEIRTVGGMVDYARAAAGAAGYVPYYLYRQTGSLSGLENVGYAKPGTESLYNVYIMDETHTILAVGAGASTKLRSAATGGLKRIYNYKYPYEYIERFETVLERKEKVFLEYQL